MSQHTALPSDKPTHMHTHTPSRDPVSRDPGHAPSVLIYHPLETSCHDQSYNRGLKIQKAETTVIRWMRGEIDSHLLS